MPVGRKKRRSSPHHEAHVGGRAAWLRAAVLGADDAIVSTASLMIGVAASAAPRSAVLVAGAAGIVAGAMSMAVGEYVSVSSQRDAEQSDIAREQDELERAPDAELRELAGIYVKRGVDRDLAMKVAEQLSARDRLGAHLRDELGIDRAAPARPLQAAWTSALSFVSFGLIPMVALLVSPDAFRARLIAVASLMSLAGLGALSGHLGGASRARAALRIAVGGGLAMATTAAIGRIVGSALG
jgi:vacuolar iron transporter family protein